MAGQLIKVNGKLLKSLYSHYGMNFEYEAGKQYACKLSAYGGADMAYEYTTLIASLVDGGYAEVIKSNVGEHKGRERVNLSFDVRDLILYNSSFDWKRVLYWAGVAPLWLIVPVGAFIIIHFVLSLPLLGLSAAAVASLTGLVWFAYIGLIGLAYLWKDHRKPPHR